MHGGRKQEETIEYVVQGRDGTKCKSTGGGGDLDATGRRREQGGGPKTDRLRSRTKKSSTRKLGLPLLWKQRQSRTKDRQNYVHGLQRADAGSLKVHFQKLSDWLHGEKERNRMDKYLSSFRCDHPESSDYSHHVQELALEEKSAVRSAEAYGFTDPNVAAITVRVLFGKEWAKMTFTEMEREMRRRGDKGSICKTFSLDESDGGICG